MLAATKTASALFRKQNITLFSRALAIKSGGIPTKDEMATGMERAQLEAFKAGVDDPFDRNLLECPPGTKDKPTLVKSTLDHRMVGCICHDDSSFINWMWLYEGEAMRCDCGHYFKLQRVQDVVEQFPHGQAVPIAQ